jgi:hypothetical protein
MRKPTLYWRIWWTIAYKGLYQIGWLCKRKREPMNSSKETQTRDPTPYTGTTQRGQVPCRTQTTTAYPAEGNPCCMSSTRTHKGL